MNRQLIFDLQRELVPSLENFVVGANQQLHGALRACARGACAESIYLWGPPGCGKTHLLRGFCSQGGSFYMDCRSPAALPVSATRLAVDNIDYADAERQQALFSAYNRARELGGAFVASGSAPPAQLQLRDDLRSRLGWGLVFQIHPLSEDDQRAALHAHATSRGYSIRPEVVDFMLKRWPRDLKSLVKVLDALDRYSMEQKRSVSLDLVRELLHKVDPAA